VLATLLLAGGCAGEPARRPDAAAPPEADALEVFGNADGNDVIDTADVAALRQIIAGQRPAGPFADATRDGVVDAQDLAQVERLIAGSASSVWLLDGHGTAQRVRVPIRRIGVEYVSNAELVRVLGAADRVVAIDSALGRLRAVYFPGRTDLASLGAMTADASLEPVVDLSLDLLLTFSPDVQAKQTRLPGVDVLFLGLYWPDMLVPGRSRFRQGVLKAGLLLGAQQRARDYLAWLSGVADTIRRRTADLAPAERPSVLLVGLTQYLRDSATRTLSVYTRIDPLSQACLLAGGQPVAERLPAWNGTGGVYATTVGLEWVLQQDPGVMVVHTVRHTYGGGTREPAYGYDVTDPAALEAAAAGIRGLPLVRDLRAARDGRLYVTAGDFRNNAMGGVLGAAYLAPRLHPARFVGFDPRAVHRTFVTRWLGLDAALVDRGVFIAPAP
jgi:iron complex transport system substrate-binding protein